MKKPNRVYKVTRKTAGMPAAAVLVGFLKGLAAIGIPVLATLLFISWLTQ